MLPIPGTSSLATWKNNVARRQAQIDVGKNGTRLTRWRADRRQGVGKETE